MLNALIAIGMWFLTGPVLTAVATGLLYAVLVVLMPFVWSYVAPFVGVTNLNGLFAAVPDSIYWGFYAFKVDVGMPLIISAYIARFLVRRLP